MGENFILDYIAKQRETRSLAEIETSLLEQGLDPDAVAEAIAESRGGDEPIEDFNIPNLAEDGGDKGTHVYELTPYDTFPNAIRLLTAPKDFFSHMKRDGGFAKPAVYILIWSAVASCMVEVVNIREGGSAVDLVSLLIAVGFGAVPISAFASIPTMIFTIMFHVACTFCGGEGDFEASFRVASSMMPLVPVFTLAAMVFPWGMVAVVLYGGVLTVYAANAVHEIPMGWSIFAAAILFAGIVSGLVFFLMN